MFTPLIEMGLFANLESLDREETEQQRKTHLSYYKFVNFALDVFVTSLKMLNIIFY